jgi:hypothetical protein
VNQKENQSMSNVLHIKPTYYPTLAERVEEYRVLDREVKKLQNALIKLKAEIIKEMGKSETVFNANGHAIATYKAQYIKAFDKEGFNAHHPGIYERFEFKKEVMVFRLKQ